VLLATGEEIVLLDYNTGLLRFPYANEIETPFKNQTMKRMKESSSVDENEKKIKVKDFESSDVSNNLDSKFEKKHHRNNNNNNN
jgi:hypothetical protein